MSFSTFRDAVLTQFGQGFATARPSFPTANILYGRTKKKQPDAETYIRVVFADIEGNYEALGKRVRQTSFLTVDIYVPEVTDLNEVESIADDVLEVLRFLVLPQNSLKTRLGKRDFANSLGGYAHTRVSVSITYNAG